jgi:hypothetical protein
LRIARLSKTKKPSGSDSRSSSSVDKKLLGERDAGRFFSEGGFSEGRFPQGFCEGGGERSSASQALVFRFCVFKETITAIV